jgi:hypothetical protein
LRCAVNSRPSRPSWILDQAVVEHFQIAAAVERLDLALERFRIERLPWNWPNMSSIGR